MGLFNPVKGQYERLARAMDDRKTIGLGAAAAVMRVRQTRVEDNLACMNRRGYFGADQPYVEDVMHLVVRDRRYAGLASLQSAVEKLMHALDQAQQKLMRTRRVSLTSQKNDRARVMGNFVRDVVDSAMTRGNAGEVLRSRAGSLVRDLIAPPGEEAFDQGQGAPDIARTLSLLSSCAAGMRDYLLAHPEERYDPSLCEYVLSLCRVVDAWSGCVPAVNQRVQGQDQTLRGLEGRMQNEFAPELSRRLDDLYAHAAQAASACDESDPLLKELGAMCLTVRSLTSRVESQSLRNAMARVNAILYDITHQIELSSECRESAGVRSLRACYLPMLRELLEKYIKYEQRHTTDPNTLSAMRETEDTLSHDLPEALMRLLHDLRAGEAIDLEAQAAALRRKMQLDGLIDDGVQLR